jgi:hypothetical protein
MKERLQKKNAVLKDELRDHHRKIARVPGKIPLQIDLERGEVLVEDKMRRKLQLDLISDSIELAIKRFVHPSDSKKVKQFLENARKGVEKPLSFNFLDPRTAEIHKYEFKYEIVYVKYSSTRLHGTLIKTG